MSSSPPPDSAATSNALTHGAYSPLLVDAAQDELLPYVDALCALSPAADPRFAFGRELLARKLGRLKLVGDHLDSKHGGSPVGAKGQIIKAARLEMELMASVERSLADLGLTVVAAAKLGLDLAKGQNLTEGIDQGRAARKRADVWIDSSVDDEDTNAA